MLLESVSVRRRVAKKGLWANRRRSGNRRRVVADAGLACLCDLSDRSNPTQEKQTCQASRRKSDGGRFGRGTRSARQVEGDTTCVVVRVIILRHEVDDRRRRQRELTGIVQSICLVSRSCLGREVRAAATVQQDL